MYGKKKKHNKNKYLIQILSFLRVDPLAMMSSTTTEICRVMLLCLLAPISTNLLNQNPTASASQTLGISTFFSKSNFLLSPSSTNHIHIQLSNNSNFPFPTFSIPTLLSPTFQIIAQVSPSHTNSFPCNCTVLYNTYYTFSPLLQFSHNEVWYLLFIPPPIQFLSITTSPPHPPNYHIIVPSYYCTVPLPPTTHVFSYILKTLQFTPLTPPFLFTLSSHPIISFQSYNFLPTFHHTISTTQFPPSLHTFSSQHTPFFHYTSLSTLSTAPLPRPLSRKKARHTICHPRVIYIAI